MDSLFVLLVSTIVIFLILAFLGTYEDLAKRSGMSVSSRRELLISPLAYSFTILVVLLPFLLLFAYPFLQIDFPESLSYVIPSGVGFFCLLIIIGSLSIWLVHGRKEPWSRCLLLSARMMLAPVIDVFWSSVAVFVAFAYASVALVMSFLVNSYIVINQTDLQSALAYLLSPQLGLPLAVIILVLGITVAYFVKKRGPSEVLSAYYLIAGYAVLALSLVSAAYLYLTFGGSTLFFDFILLIAGLLVCAIYQAISRLYHSLRVVGVFGLELVLFSLLLMILTYESLQIRGVPIFGEIVYSLIPSFVWTISFEIGIVGLVAGVLVIFVARKQPEKGQIMTQAMSIAIGVSAFLPLLMQLSPISVFSAVGSLLGLYLAFVLVAPVYLFSLNILRVKEAVKTLLHPPVFGKRCFSCGHLNNPKARFCGKCGQRL